MTRKLRVVIHVKTFILHMTVMTSTSNDTLVTNKHMKTRIVLSGATFYNKIIKPQNTVVNEGSNSSKNDE